MLLTIFTLNPITNLSTVEIPLHLPVLIPSKRDNNLMPDFGLVGGGTGGVTSFFDKRAET